MVYRFIHGTSTGFIDVLSIPIHVDKLSTHILMKYYHSRNTQLHSTFVEKGQSVFSSFSLNWIGESQKVLRLIGAALLRGSICALFPFSVFSSPNYAIPARIELFFLAASIQ